MKYFTLTELTNSRTAANRRINNEPTAEVREALTALVDHVLDPIRKAYGKPIYVNSGYRCAALNQLVGGAAGSQHLKGEAADIRCDDNRALMKLILKMNLDRRLTFDQLILERCWRDRRGLQHPAWIHISYTRRRRNRGQVIYQ